MHSFKTTDGASWHLRLTVWHRDYLVKELDVDLYKLLDDNFAGLNKLLNDPPLITNIVYLLLQSDKDHQPPSAEEFAKLLTGPALEDLTEAFTAELADFFPNRQARAALPKVMAKAKELGEAVQHRLDQKLAALDLEQMMNHLAEKSNGQSLALPAKAA